MAITHAQRKFIRELQQRQARRKYGAFLVEGPVNVGELLASKVDIDVLIATAAAWDGLGADDALPPHRERLPVELVGEAAYARLSTQRSPSGIMAVARIPVLEEPAIASAPRILYLDGINDPGNAGTLLRSAEWFGVDAVCASPESVDWYSPKTVSAARGSLFRMPHLHIELARLLDLRPHTALVVADFGGVFSRRFAWPSSGILLLGNESHGPGATARDLVQRGARDVHVVTIAGAGRATESLNASVAGGILLADWLG